MGVSLLQAPFARGQSVPKPSTRLGPPLASETWPTVYRLLTTRSH
jgi:hypothetical protein